MSYNADGMLTADGQVMIPNSIRERLGIKASDRLPFHLTDLGELSVPPFAGAASSSALTNYSCVSRTARHR